MLTINRLQERKHKISKAIKKNYSEPKIFRNLNFVDTKSVIKQHATTSYKLFKAIRDTEKVSHVGSNSFYLFVQ